MSEYLMKMFDTNKQRKKVTLFRIVKLTWLVMLLALGVVSNSSLANDEVEIGYYRQLLLDQKFGVLEKDLRLVNDGY